jgi:triphosphatase
VSPLQETRPQKEEFASLQAVLRRKRREAFDRAVSAVQDRRCQRIILDTALWLAGGLWSRTSDQLVAARRNQPVIDLARQELADRTAKLAKKADKLEDLDARGRHKVRIAAKKLRYATEFFASIFPDSLAKKRRKRFGAALKKLQSALGRINDIAVHERITGRLMNSPEKIDLVGRDAAFGMGMTAEKERADVAPSLASARKAGARLANLHVFWS